MNPKKKVHIHIFIIARFVNTYYRNSSKYSKTLSLWLFKFKTCQMCVLSQKDAKRERTHEARALAGR